MSGIAFREARFPNDLATVRGLFEEYQASIGLDLCFQGFQEELATLPGRYAAPEGSLWLAWDETDGAGCVAMRPLQGEACELKRLYVRPEHRGQGIARALAHRVIEDARAAGYRLMRLDTLGSMEPARALYRSLEFAECEPYYANPLPDVVYMERRL